MQHKAALFVLILMCFLSACAVQKPQNVNIQKEGKVSFTPSTEPSHEPQTVDKQTAVPSAPSVEDAVPKSSQTPTAKVPSAEVSSPRGNAGVIPEDVRNKMAGISMVENPNIGYDDLSYLSVPYIDFQGNRQIGNMVVHQSLAEEVLDIFAELYMANYAIESMRPIEAYYDKQTEVLDSLDRASMGNNNTSAFCYRPVSGTSHLSQHAYGRAIDINPKINPYVVNGYVSPANAQQYADRSGKKLSSVENKAMIHKDDIVYRAFVSRGWEWGGDWKNIKDYQHFQKKK